MTDIKRYFSGKRGPSDDGGMKRSYSFNRSPMKQCKLSTSFRDTESSIVSTLVAKNSTFFASTESTDPPQVHHTNVSEGHVVARLNEKRTKTESYNWDNHPRVSIQTMRTPVMDWLFDVCVEFGLKHRTLQLAINVFDRFMASAANVHTSQLQLVGITSFWIACKFEEIDVPRLANIVWVAADEYSEDDVINTEMLILKALNWDVAAIPLVEHLRANIPEDSANNDLRAAAEYISMILLYDINLLTDYSYSMIARAIWAWVSDEGNTVTKTLSACIQDVQSCYHNSSRKLHPTIFINNKNY